MKSKCNQIFPKQKVGNYPQVEIWGWWRVNKFISDQMFWFFSMQKDGRDESRDLYFCFNCRNDNI